MVKNLPSSFFSKPIRLLLALVGIIVVVALLWSRQASRPAVTPALAAPENSAVATRSAPRRPPPESRLSFLRDTTQPWQIRVDRLRELFADDGCAEHELLELYDMLADGAPATELPEHGYVLANDLMIQLSQRDHDRQRFASRFIQLLQDPRQPPVIRDYAVQFLASMCRPQPQTTARTLAAPSPAVVSQVLDALVNATLAPERKHSSVPGTTLMMLATLARSGQAEVVRPFIGKLTPWIASALKGEGNVSMPVRVSAIQAAGLLAPSELRPLVRELAFGEGQQLSFRLPSIAALGQCGEPEDLPRLAALASQFPDLSHAVSDASIAINDRIPSPNVTPAPF